MPEDKKKYRVGEDVYEIPKSDEKGFLERFSNAIPVNTYVVDKDTFEVPVNDLDGFLQYYPGAELADGSKKKVSSQGSGTEEEKPQDGSTQESPQPSGFRTVFEKGQPSTDAGKVDKFYKEGRTQKEIAEGEYGEAIGKDPLSPSSSFEYITQAGGSQSLLFKGLAYLIFMDEALKLNKDNPMDYAAGKIQEMAQENQVSLESYGANRAEDIAASIFGLALDSGVFAGMGGVAKGGLKAGGWVKNQMVRRGVKKAVADKAAKSVVRKHIARGAAESGLTLGQYMGASNALHQLEQSGTIEDFEAGQVIKEFGKGAILGMGVGVLGSSAGIINNSIMSRGIRNQLGKKAATAGVTTAATVAEGGLFELGGSLLEGEKATVDGWVDNILIFGAMKAGGVPSKFKEGKRDIVDYTPEELNQIDGEAKLGKSRDQIIKDLSKDKKALEEVLNNPDIAWTTKSKLAYEIAGVPPVNPPEVLGYNMESSPEGRTVIETTDANGAVVERAYYNTKAEAMKDAINIDAAIKESIEIKRYNDVNAEEFNQIEAGLKEKGHEGLDTAEKLHDALILRSDQRTPEQKKLVDDWMEIMGETKLESEKETERMERPDPELKIEESKEGKFVVKQEGTPEGTEFNTREEAEAFKEKFEILTQGERTFEEQKQVDKEDVAAGKKKKPEPKVEKDAVQKPKAEKVDVEEPSTPGKGVGKEKPKAKEKEVGERYTEEIAKAKEEQPDIYWSVDKPSDADIKSAAKEGRIIETENGKAIVKPDGDIVGVFKDPASKKKGVADELLKGAIERGGKKLDNFDGYLTGVYERNGFRVASRIPFDPAQAPKDMPAKEKAKKPDVVFMVHDPAGKIPADKLNQKFKDYGEAVEYRDKMLKKPAKEEIRLAEDMKSLAEKIRSKKIDLKGGQTFATVPGGPQAINFAMEAVAKGLEAGATIVEAVDGAIKSIREQGFYKKLSGEEKKELEAYIRNEIQGISGQREKQEVELPSGEPAPAVKSKITDKEFEAEMDAAVKEFDKTIRQETKEAKRSYTGEVIERRIALNTGAYETNLMVDGIRRSTTKDERIASTLLLEKAGVPEEYKGTKVEELYNNPTEAVKKTVELSRKYFDEAWDQIVENTDKMSVDQIENYVTHIWDIPKSKVESVAQWFSTRNKFLNKRSIATIKEGMDKFGIEPKTLDVGEIIKIHSSAARNAIENNKFIEAAKKIDVGGFSLLSKAKDAPAGWIKYEHPALSYKTIVGNDSKGRPIRITDHYYVPREMKASLDALFGSTKVGDAKLAEVWRAYDNIGNYLKKTQLSLSLFHHGALTETAIANMGLPKAMKTVLYDIGFKGTFKKGVPAFQNPEVARWAVENGVQLGAAQDFDVAKIQKQIDQLFKNTKGTPLQPVTWSLKEFNKSWDRGLWEYLHDGLKIYTFEHMASKIDPAKLTPDQYKKRLRETAQFVNDSYGGQNWDVLGVSPMQQRVMRAFLLSPDWTISTIRQALAPTGVGTLYKSGEFWNAGKKGNPYNMRRKHGAAFWLKAAMWYGSGINILNAVARKKDMQENPDLYTEDELAVLDKSIKDIDLKDPKQVSAYLEDLSNLTMVNNTVGHKTHLFDGRYDDGKERYIRWGKQFRELPELFMDESGVNFPRPMLRKMGGKMSPQMQLAFQALTGKTASGYENYDMKNKDGWDFTMGLMKTIAKSALPFSTSSMLREDKQWRPADIMMPSSKGLSAYKAEQYFFRGIEAQDPQYVSEVYDSAVRNKLDAFELFTTAMRRHKRTLESEGDAVSNDVKDLEKRLKTEQDPDKRAKIVTKLSELEAKRRSVSRARSNHDAAEEQLRRYIDQYNKKWKPVASGEGKNQSPKKD